MLYNLQFAILSNMNQINHVYIYIYIYIYLIYNIYDIYIYNDGLQNCAFFVRLEDLVSQNKILKI